jgi:hypothetical protein
LNEPKGVTLTEDRIPREGLEACVEELVEVYGGEMKARSASGREFLLPLRRGVPTSGSIECSLSWTEDGEETAVTLACDRNVDAPKLQRILLLAAGVVGVVLFMLWPFYPHQKEFGTLAWLGGIIAIAVYFMSLKKTSGGIANDFLQRLAEQQRGRALEAAGE